MNEPIRQRCVLLEAMRELEEERFKKAVEEEKERQRKKIPLLFRLFPFEIVIRKRKDQQK